MFLSLNPRWNRRTTLSDSTRLRAEVFPPSLRCKPGPLWQRLLFWLMAPAPAEAAPPLSCLPAVRRDFVAGLADIVSPDAQALRQRLREAHTLRELWHLRSELYRVVGVALNQAEAERRLAGLNRHFPTRAPRSQFVPL